MLISFIGIKGVNFGNNAFGGFETVCTELGPRFIRHGYKVTIYCRKNLYNSTDKLPQQYNGVMLKFINSIETKNLGTMTHSFLSFVDSIRNKADVIFLFNLGPGIFLPFVKLFGIKVVTNLDGVEWERSKWSFGARLMFIIGAYFNVKFADYLIADAEEIRKIYFKKFKRDSIVIPYGAEIRKDLTPDSIRKYGLNPNDYYLVATRFIPENNSLFIVKNFIKANTNKKLVVLGKNYYMSSYEKDLLKYNSKKVLFLGHINDRKLLYEFYYYSYCYIHGHSVGGTNPTMLEALANSCCVLSLDTKFNREMLKNGEYGLFFKLNDKSFFKLINYVENNKDVVDKFKLKSRKRIINYYNWEIVEDKYLSLLEELNK